MTARNASMFMPSRALVAAAAGAGAAGVRSALTLMVDLSVPNDLSKRTSAGVNPLLLTA